jgi:hypothetical protein
MMLLDGSSRRVRYRIPCIEISYVLCILLAGCSTAPQRDFVPLANLSVAYRYSRIKNEIKFYFDSPGTSFGFDVDRRSDSVVSLSRTHQSYARVANKREFLRAAMTLTVAVGSSGSGKFNHPCPIYTRPVGVGCFFRLTITHP